MKYAEYQVWYHVYTSVAASMYTSANFLPHEIINKADAVATHAVEKFRSVEDMPQAPNLDVQGIVDKVLKDASKKK
jgi:hypothetical protein